MTSSNPTTDLQSAGKFIELVNGCLAQGLILPDADPRLKSALDGALHRTRNICLYGEPTPGNCKVVEECLAQVLFLFFDKILFPKEAPREFIQTFLDCIEIALEKCANAASQYTVH